MTDAIPLEEAERRWQDAAPPPAGGRQRPTAEGSMEAWLKLEGPVHAPSLAHKPLPPREWTVEGIIPHRCVALLSGDGGSGKSTLALQLACSTVLGRPWLGRNTRPGKVAYVSCEDDVDEVHRRLAGICEGEGWTLGDLDGLEVFDRVGRDSAIMFRGERFGAWEDTPWWIRFSNWVRDFGPSLVVLDSLYDFFVGNQLDMASAGLFMTKLRELAHDAECTIFVLWHPSKAGMESGDGTSGNRAFRNKSRAMLYLERDPNAQGTDAPRLLRWRKGNYGPEADDVTVRWECGRFVPVASPGTQTGVFAGIAQRNAERAFLSCLDAVTSQGRHVTDARNSPRYAPKIFSEMREAAGFRANDLHRAMVALFGAGTIKVGGIPGPDRHPVKAIVRVSP